METILEAQKEIVPLKHVFRAQLIEKLKAAKAEGVKEEEKLQIG